MLNIPYRFKVLRPWFYWMTQRHSPLAWRASVGEMLVQLIQPSLKSRVMSWVDFMEDQNDFKVIKFRQLKYPVWWPISLPLHDLWVVADEQFNRRHWHRYESDDTDVHSDDVVMDCGASEGLFALTIVDRCQHIHLIEPSPLYRSALERTFEGFKNVTIHPVGLSDINAVSKFNDNGVISRFDPAADSANRINIIRADDLLAGNEHQPTYIKADIEGWELPMLRGAEGILRDTARKIAITVYHVPTNNYQEIQDFLSDISSDYKFRYVGVTDTMTPTGQPAPILMHASR